VRSKKCARAKVNKEGNGVKESPTTAKHGHISVWQPDDQKIFQNKKEIKGLMSKSLIQRLCKKLTT